MDSPAAKRARKVAPATNVLDVVDVGDCELITGHGGLEYRRLYNAEDGVVGICTQPANFNSPTHWHEAPELIYTLKGSACTRVGDDWVPLAEGQCLVPGPMIQHWTKTENESFHCLYFFPDGPQENRLYHREGSEACPAGHSPLVTPSVNMAVDGQHELVNDTYWHAKVHTISAGRAVIEDLWCRFIFVLSGTVELRVLGDSSLDDELVTVSALQLVRVSHTGLRAHVTVAAGEAAHLLCVKSIDSPQIAADFGISRTSANREKTSGEKSLVVD